MSTLTYIAQLERPPAETMAAEQQRLKKVVKGPHAWVEPDDLWRLKEHYGQSSSIKSLQHTTMAAQLRVRLCDPCCTQADYQANVADLRTAVYSGCNNNNRLRWALWYQHSSPSTLEGNSQHHKQHIGSTEQLIQQPLGNKQQKLKSSSHGKSNFQRNAYNKLLQAEPYNPSTRNRAKMSRWDLHDALKHPAPSHTSCRQNTPAWQSRRALANLQLLQQLAPPRVCAAALSTLWNRWCTHRRFQKRHLVTNRCMLGSEG